MTPAVLKNSHKTFRICSKITWRIKITAMLLKIISLSLRKLQSQSRKHRNHKLVRKNNQDLNQRRRQLKNNSLKLNRKGLRKSNKSNKNNMRISNKRRSSISTKILNILSLLQRSLYRLNLVKNQQNYLRSSLNHKNRPLSPHKLRNNRSQYNKQKQLQPSLNQYNHPR